MDDALAGALAALDRAQLDLFQARAQLRALQAVNNPELMERLEKAAIGSSEPLDLERLAARGAELIGRIASGQTG